MKDFKEIDLEDFIVNEFKHGRISARGLDMKTCLLFRQFEISGCGVIDLMTVRIVKTKMDRGIFKYILVDVYELKRNELNCADFGQLCRYMHVIRHNMKRFLNEVSFCPDYNIDVSGILIGDGIQRDALCLYNEMFSGDISVYNAELSMEKGIEFKTVEFSNSIQNVKVGGFGKNLFRRIAKASRPIVRDLRTIPDEDIEITNEMFNN